MHHHVCFVLVYCFLIYIYHIYYIYVYICNYLPGGYFILSGILWFRPSNLWTPPRSRIASATCNYRNSATWWSMEGLHHGDMKTLRKNPMGFFQAALYIIYDTYIYTQGFQCRSLTCAFHKVDVKHSDYKKYMFMPKPLCFTLSSSCPPCSHLNHQVLKWSFFHLFPNFIASSAQHLWYASEGFCTSLWPVAWLLAAYSFHGIFLPNPWVLAFDLHQQTYDGSGGSLLTCASWKLGKYKQNWCSTKIFWENSRRRCSCGSSFFHTFNQHMSKGLIWGKHFKFTLGSQGTFIFWILDLFIGIVSRECFQGTCHLGTITQESLRILFTGKKSKMMGIVDVYCSRGCLKNQTVPEHFRSTCLILITLRRLYASK